MQMGGGSPEASVSVLVIQNAALTKSEESLVLDRNQGGMNFSSVA